MYTNVQKYGHYALIVYTYKAGPVHYCTTKGKSMVNNFVTLCSIYIFIDLYKKESLPHLTTKKREGRMPFVYQE